MRELEYTIVRALRVGLRPYHKTSRDDSALLEARNTRVGPLGLEPIEPVDRFVEVTRSWPFPQYIDTEGGDQFVVVRSGASDVLYQLSGSTVVAIATLSQGTRIELADFTSYRLFTNGVTMVRVLNGTPAIGGAIATIPLFRTCCNFKGQCVAGNVTSSWHGRGVNSVIWSAIGSIDFTPGIGNTAGFRDLPSEVYGVRHLGDRILCYGAKQLGWLLPASDPAPTFGYKNILSVGLAGRYAHGGDELEQVFVDEEGWLWRLNEQGLKRLGYREFMTQMTASSIVVTFDRFKRDFGISDGAKSFLLSPHGLSETHQAISGMLRRDGALVGDYEDLGKHDFRILTDTLDFGYRGAKTLMTYEVGADVPGKMSLSAGWRAERGQEMRVVGPVPVNDQGVATLIVSGTEFQVALEASSPEEMNLNYLKLRYKMTDLRSLRGVYAPPLRGQSDQPAAS